MSIASTSETAIWERVIQPDRGELAAGAAQFFLGLSFGQDDLARLHELAEKNQQGTLSAEEAEALRNYRQIGMQIELLRSKARIAISPQK